MKGEGEEAEPTVNEFSWERPGSPAAALCAPSAAVKSKRGLSAEESRRGVWRAEAALPDIDADEERRE